MKRLHLVGTSKDGKRLLFAQKKGAKFGSLEAPISAKLLRLIEEFQQAREAKRKPARSKAEEAPEAPSAPSDLGAEAEPPAGPEAVPALASVPEPSEPEAPPQVGIVASDQIDIPVAPPAARGKEEPAAEPLPGIGELPRNHPSTGLTQPDSEMVEETVAKIERIRPRTEKPEIPARSKLTPAEIQGLIRSGRGIRSVANLAGTPLDWVRYLAEPIQEERRGIVRQMLTRRQERARLGLSASTIGESILENLRARGIRSPELIVEEAFTAFRPDGREWRVRLVFEHRGRRQTASWSFDAQTRRVTPLNSLATSLGWRRPPDRDGEGRTQPTRARRTGSTRGRARTLKSSGRKRTTARRKPARKTSSARSSRRRSSR